MQRIPETMCTDPFHQAKSPDEVDGIQFMVDAGGGWFGIGWECRTCGYQSIRHVLENWLSKVKTVCPGCDAIRLDWDDEHPLCDDCKLRDVRIVTFICDEQPPNIPMDDMDLEALIEDWPSIFWPWERVLEYLYEDA
jgi:hypothetical protein